MRLFISTSPKNHDAYCRLRESLIPSPIEVMDWTALFFAPVPELKHPHDTDGRVFRFCAEACASADLVVYLGPAGQDAACEIGMAFASGVPVWGVAGQDERPGVMLAHCVSRWLPSLEDVALELTRWRGW